jgi:hypothetical protein
MVVGSLVSNAATTVGFMAASIAVGGFIAHAGPALTNQSDSKLRYATVVGGLAGLGIAALIVSVGNLLSV